ncbi:MAG: hypothetical protein FWE67_12525, partial [Planctomycetaceae bacterium]|nr:hypothetical protein [Planctomycetaceae bacterium]
MSHLFRSIWYDIRINTAVMLGVMCAAAVLTGALLVGDSMRGSLKALTLQRLGSIDTILFAPNFIDFKTADGRRQTAEEAVILLPAVVEFNGRISGIQLLGRADTVCSINQTLADKLQIKAGGELSLRFLSPQSIPPESTFGKHDNLLRTKITVDKIIADEGVGRFSLKVDQQAEPLLIVPLEFMQSKLGVGKKVNAVFFMTDSPQTLLTAGQREALEKHFEPTLEDLGIDVEEHGGKWYIKSARMLFTNAQAEAIFRHSREGGNLDERLSSLAPRLRGGDDSRGRNVFHAGLLYLATSIRAVKNGREVPYSTVYATDFFTQRHEGTEEDNLCASVPPCEKKIALNQWTAEDLGVEVGDEIELTWFEPDNVNVTKSQTFTIKSIVPNELYPNEVVPIVKGFTDEKSIADWDPPFPFDAKKIRKKDEDYWDKYRAAPKAVVPLAVGQKLWGSRFGNVTTFVANRHPRASGELDEGLFSLGSRLRGNDKGSGNDGFLSLFGLN